MKRLLLSLTCLIVVLGTASAQSTRPFKGNFYNKENDIRLSIDLYDTTIVAPAYAFLGKMNGYMTGRLYDVWFITKCQIKDGKAHVEFSNDIGADTQDVIFTPDSAGNLLYEARGTNVIRRAERGKWIKLPTKMTFVRNGRNKSRL